MIREIIELDRYPSEKLIKLENSGILKEILPELSNLDYINISKTGKTHKNNFYHSLQVLDNIAKVSDNPILRWAAVLHDIGKYSTAQETENGWGFHGHDIVGAEMVTKILVRLGIPEEYHSDIHQLVLLHMRPVTLIKKEITDSAIRRLMTEAGSLLEPLMMLAVADITSSKNKSQYTENIMKVKSRMQEIHEKDFWSSINPVINGTWIMNNCELHDQSEIGTIKEYLKFKIVKENIPNEVSSLMPYLYQICKQLDVKVSYP